MCWDHAEALGREMSERVWVVLCVFESGQSGVWEHTKG